MPQQARPTLRCLREDLGQPIPRADTPLDEVPHPLLAKASERFADDSTPQERIASVDDHVGFKVKVQRWRGAVWVAEDAIPWLVAGGQREDGSPDDFYAALAARGKAARSQYNAAHTPPLTTDTCTDDLLPAAEDELRWKAEHAVRMERRLRVTVHSLLRESLLDGHEHASMLDGAALGIQVQAEEGYSTPPSRRWRFASSRQTRRISGVLASRLAGASHSAAKACMSFSAWAGSSRTCPAPGRPYPLHSVTPHAQGISPTSCGRS
jgi:hypothetical protein